MIKNKDFQNNVHVGLDDPFGLMNLINEYLNNLQNYFPISSRIMFTAASMTYQRQRKREKEAAKRALAKMEVILFGGSLKYYFFYLVVANDIIKNGKIHVYAYMIHIITHICFSLKELPMPVLGLSIISKFLA